MKLLPRNETELRLYAIGYLDGKVNGYSNMDGAYWYKRGFDAGIADYCYNPQCEEAESEQV